MGSASCLWHLQRHMAVCCCIESSVLGALLRRLADTGAFPLSLGTAAGQSTFSFSRAKVFCQVSKIAEVHDAVQHAAAGACKQILTHNSQHGDPAIVELALNQPWADGRVLKQPGRIKAPASQSRLSHSFRRVLHSLASSTAQ